MPWTYSLQELVINDVTEVDESNAVFTQFRGNGEWNLATWSRKNYIMSYENNSYSKYSAVNYKFTIKRRWLFTILNLVAPVVITSLLNPLSFLLPVDSGERISLSNTVFLTLAVFFTIVSNSLPQTSEGSPIFVTYIGLQMFGSVLTIAFTIISLACYYSDNDLRQNNALLRVLFYICGKAKTEKGAESNPENLEKYDSEHSHSWEIGKMCSKRIDRESAPYTGVNNAQFIKNLFDGYSVNVLPVVNIDRPVTISQHLYHMSIDNIDMKSKIVSTRIVLGLEWIDEYLKWNPSDFRNISKFSMQASSIWLPDLYAGNSDKLLTFIRAEDIKEVFLSSNGKIEAWSYLQIEIGISLDIYKYPFDTQICDFEFISWIHSNSRIDLYDIHESENTDPSKLSRQNGEWDMIKVDRYRFNKTYDNYVTNFTMIRYRITLRRKWQYTIWNLIAPVVLTSLLNPLSFLLPVESGERISLSNTVFLTLAVFFSIVNDSLPKTSEEVPILVAYIGLQMLGSVLTIMFTIFSLALYHNNRNIDQSSIWSLIFGKRGQKKDVSHEEVNGAADMGKIMGTQQECDNRDAWTKVSNIFDKACFWLSLAWNIILLAIVFIEVNAD
ncbi:neuronal acetylcholine receptor subunit alpha-10-like [Ruditapes philippinarum]|uniref:neuronal acetylcholine receptor subunit alpha-10-like n=1 Tax=Ruditapes philippinarum TaxID=129788 RepID=UPI00295A6499|nr:neuronal acetylcholine receptor subunit alpha-10-like [Ruditapes philippinarum]